MHIQEITTTQSFKKMGLHKKLPPPPQETLNDFDRTVQVYLNWIPADRDATLTQNSYSQSGIQ